MSELIAVPYTQVITTSSSPAYQHTETQETWWNAQAATLLMLKLTQDRIVEAEKRIHEQEQRIRELEEQAETDVLTGLMNRRGFEQAFSKEVEHIRRKNSAGSVLLLIDLDNLKDINDLYGHQAGDACLKRAASEIMHTIRQVDSAARFGGDEFAVLLSHTTLEKVYERLKKIRQNLQNMPLRWEGKTIICRASMGVAELTHDGLFSDAYKSADIDLYQAKQQKNRLLITL